MIDDHNIQDTRIRQLNPVNIRVDVDYVLIYMLDITLFNRDITESFHKCLKLSHLIHFL